VSDAKKHGEDADSSAQHLSGQSVRCPHCGENNVAAEVRCWACDAELHQKHEPAPVPRPDPEQAAAQEAQRLAGLEADQQAELENRRGPSWQELYTPGCVIPGIVAAVIMLVLSGLLFADVVSGHWWFGRRELAMAVILVVGAVATLISVFKKDLWS
jgi:hypothetical protein